MDNTYTEATFESSLRWREKLVLLGMIYNMDNGSKTTWISQPNLAKLCGMAKNAAIAGLKELEAQGVISHVGWHKVTPQPTVKRRSTKFS